MAGFANDAKKMLELLGGKENIVSFTHCATRMRFVLKDQKQADVKAIEELSCVKGSFYSGRTVSDHLSATRFLLFMMICRGSGLSVVASKTEAKGNLNLLQRLLANWQRFCADIPAIIVGGLILGFRNIIGDIALLENGTKTITAVYPFWNGVYNFLWLIGEAIFTFLPVIITYSVCQKK